MASRLDAQRIALDANILMELFFRRERYDQVFAELSAITNERLCASALSVDILLYYVEVKKSSKPAVWQFIAQYQILDVSSGDITWARDNDAGDFEDALQVACARRNGCERFITLDNKLADMYGNFIDVTTIR